MKKISTKKIARRLLYFLDKSLGVRLVGGEMISLEMSDFLTYFSDVW